MMTATQREKVGDDLYSVDIEGSWGTEKFAAKVTARVTFDESNPNDAGEPAWCAELASATGRSGEPVEIPAKAIEYALAVIETDDPGISI